MVRELSLNDNMSDRQSNIWLIDISKNHKTYGTDKPMKPYETGFYTDYVMHKNSLPAVNTEQKVWDAMCPIG